MKRVVDDDEVLAALDGAIEEGRARNVSGDRRRRLLRDRVGLVLSEAIPFDEAPLPPLAGLAETAEILDVKKQYIARLIKQNVLVPAARFASGPIFRKHHVEAYAVQLREARRVREERAVAKADEGDDT